MVKPVKLVVKVEAAFPGLVTCEFALLLRSALLYGSGSIGACLTLTFAFGNLPPLSLLRISEGIRLMSLLLLFLFVAQLVGDTNHPKDPAQEQHNSSRGG